MSISTNTKPASAPEDKPVKAGSKLSGTHEDLSRPSLQNLDVSGESVDFNSILSAISGNSEQNVSSEEENTNPTAHKNLNISSVIAEIQDEGPAGKHPESGRMEGAATRQNVAGQDSGPVQQAANSVVQEQADRSASAQATEVEKCTENVIRAVQSPPVLRHGILERFLLTVLMVVLVTAGYFLHRNEKVIDTLRKDLALLVQKQDYLEQEIGLVHNQLLENQPKQKQVEQQPATPSTPETGRQIADAWIPAGFHVPQRPLAVMIAGVTARVTKKAHAEQGRKPEKTVSAGAPSTIQPAPTAKGRGQWMVHLASSGNRKKAVKLLDVYIKKAPDAILRPATVKGRKLYRVTVPGLETKEEALAYQKRIGRELGLKGVWIERNKTARKTGSRD
ncbi:SPOR domain-containing protein [Thiolapillus sp.]